MERGLGFRIFCGLGGRVGGLGDDGQKNIIFCETRAKPDCSNAGMKYRNSLLLFDHWKEETNRYLKFEKIHIEINYEVFDHGSMIRLDFNYYSEVGEQETL